MPADELAADLDRRRFVELDGDAVAEEVVNVVAEVGAGERGEIRLRRSVGIVALQRGERSSRFGNLRIARRVGLQRRTEQFVPPRASTCLTSA